jgi:hypothetical protein
MWNSTCFLRVIGFFDDQQWLKLSRSVLSLGLLRIPKLFMEHLLTIEQQRRSNWFQVMMFGI